MSLPDNDQGRIPLASLGTRIQMGTCPLLRDCLSLSPSIDHLSTLLGVEVCCEDAHSEMELKTRLLKRAITFGVLAEPVDDESLTSTCLTSVPLAMMIPSDHALANTTECRGVDLTGELISLPCNERYPEACQAVWNAVASTVPDAVAVDYHTDFRDIALNVSYGAVGANFQLGANRAGQFSSVRVIDANLPLYLVWSRDFDLAPIDKALAEFRRSASACQLP